ncbi:MAG: hypothetical protein HKL90_07735 [Elusimicrobia bacterium]|nr:hypothetical protein [Elusimicrobiota bacterium]
MEDWGRFGLMLVNMREERGFASARKFYRTAGGAGHFGCTYRHYANVEKGRCGPSERLLAAVCAALGFREDLDSARRLLEEYFRQKFPADLMDLLRSAWLKGGHNQEPDIQSALVRHARENSRPISAQQVLAYCSSPAAYGVYEILSNDLRRWSPGDLAGLLKLDPEKVRKAAEQLKSAGILKRDATGRFWCPGPEKIMVSNNTNDPRLVQAYGKLTGLWRELQKPSGRRLFCKSYVLRCSLSEFQAYSVRLSDAFHGSAILRTCRKGPDTALVGIELNAFKFFDF